jgi:AMIN domain
MSQSHQAFRQKRQDPPTDPETQKDTPHSRPFEEVKEDLGAPRKRRSTPSANSFLFQSDPEENVRLWMQKYFPGVTLSREEAIRQWLARPPEFRVQSILESPSASCEAPTATDIPAPPSQEQKDGDSGRSKQDDSENPRRHREPGSEPILTSAASAFTDRSRKINRLVFRLVACAVLAFVIIKLLWAIPETHLFSRADSSVPEAKSRTAEPVAPPVVPVSNGREETAAQPESATGPNRIEKLSIGCSDAQPCLEITTQGKKTVPTLSTLTNPDRLVMDFQDASYSADIHRINVGRGSLKAVRVSGTAGSKSSSTRVVLDLTTSCDYDLQTLTNKLVVNLRAKAAQRRPE